ncbi:MAG: hypothetical protein ACYTG0_37580 [Planctomycetota bacterium]|jgi:hypothetical protein
MFSKSRIAVFALALAATLSLLASQSRADLFGWTRFGSASDTVVGSASFQSPLTARRVVLMPVVSSTPTAGVAVGQSCYTPQTCCYTPQTSCYTPQTCSYTPQVNYRWSYSRMEVTSMRPVAKVDPCTGCQTTVLQPVTQKTLLPWLHRKPQVSYQLTCSASACSVPSCATGCFPAASACGAAGCFPATSSLGSSCSSGCSPFTTVPGSTAVPALDPGYDSPGSTFQTDESDEGTGESADDYDYDVRPSPEASSEPASTHRPRLLRPENRTASESVRYAAYQPPVRSVRPAASPSRRSLDVSGWRASHD